MTRVYWKVGIVGFGVMVLGLAVAGWKFNAAQACTQPILLGVNPHAGINCPQVQQLENAGVFIFWLGIVLMVGTILTRLWRGATRPRSAPVVGSHPWPPTRS